MTHAGPFPRCSRSSPASPGAGFSSAVSASDRRLSAGAPVRAGARSTCATTTWTRFRRASSTTARSTACWSSSTTPTPRCWPARTTSGSRSGPPVTTAASASRSTPETAGSPSWRRCPARRASVPASVRAICWSRWTAISAAGWTHGARGAGAARPDRHDDRPGGATRRRRGAAPPPPHARADPSARGLRGSAARRRRRLSVAVDGAGELRRRSWSRRSRAWSAQGMKSLVLDLRSDPGGLRDEAVQAADLFLDPRQDILVSRGRAPGDNHRWTDGAPQRWRGLPIVVLVNRGRPVRRRSSRARCRTTTAPWSWATRPTARASCRRCSRWGPTWRSGSPRPAGTRRAGGRSRARRSTRRWARRTRPPTRRPTARTGDGRSRAAAGSCPTCCSIPTPSPRRSRASAGARRTARGVPRRAHAPTRWSFAARGTVASEASGWIRRCGTRCGERLAGAGRAAGGQHLPAAGQQILDQQLGYEMARYVFGPAAERRRRVERRPPDRPGGRATAPGARTPSALLGLASRPAARLTDPPPGRRTAPRR